MRLGLVLPDTAQQLWASAADAAGLFGVAVSTGSGGVDAVRAAAVTVATRDTRVIVRVELGLEHPVTLAEELAVLDTLSAGRVVGLLDTGVLTAEEAAEDIGLVQRGLSARPIRHRGARWTVPAGLNPEATDAVIVTPEPVQIEIPLWLTGLAAEGVAAGAVAGDTGAGLPVLVTDAQGPLSASGVQPAVATITGVLDDDRAAMIAWAAAGASHLLLRVGPGLGVDVLADYVGRYLIPEVAMVQFPRILAETTPPPLWPGAVR